MACGVISYFNRVLCTHFYNNRLCLPFLGNCNGRSFYWIILFAGHLEHGFFMNWFGDKEGEGFEYHLLMIGLCLALFIQGSGKYSLDNLISKKWLLFLQKIHFA